MDTAAATPMDIAAAIPMATAMPMESATAVLMEVEKKTPTETNEGARMKKMLLVCCSLALCLCMGACSPGKSDEQKSDGGQQEPVSQNVDKSDQAGDSDASDGTETNDPAASGAEGESSGAQGATGAAGEKDSDGEGKTEPKEPENAGASPNPVGSSDPEKDSGKKEEAEGYVCAIYSLNEQADGLVYQDKVIESSSAWHIWAELKRTNSIIPIKAGLNSYEIAQGVGYLDFEAEIYSMNAGGSVEGLVIQAIANTYIKGTAADVIIIRVDGEPYESGHFLLDEPISYRE